MGALRTFLWTAIFGAAVTAAVYGVLQIGNVLAEIAAGIVAGLLAVLVGALSLFGPGGASTLHDGVKRSVPVSRQIPYWLQLTSILVGMGTGVGGMAIALFKG